ADDVGSILIEENVVYAAGVRNRTNEGELRCIIAEAGFRPEQRDTLYRSYVWKPPVARELTAAWDERIWCTAFPGVTCAGGAAPPLRCLLASPACRRVPGRRPDNGPAGAWWRLWAEIWRARLPGLLPRFHRALGSPARRLRDSARG